MEHAFPNVCKLRLPFFYSEIFHVNNADFISIKPKSLLYHFVLILIVLCANKIHRVQNSFHIRRIHIFQEPAHHLRTI